MEHFDWGPCNLVTVVLCDPVLVLFEFSALSAAWQIGQPMHSQSARRENLFTQFTQFSSHYFA